MLGNADKGASSRSSSDTISERGGGESKYKKEY